MQLFPSFQCGIRFLLFPHIVVWGSCFFAAPPRSSSALLPPSSFNLSHTTSLTTTSCCTSSLVLLPPSSFLLPPSSPLTQHLSQQHLSLHRNITQTTSRTQHTTSLTQHRMPRGRMTKHHSENIPHTDNTSHTPQCVDFVAGAVNLRVQVSWQAQHFAACQGVGCTPWRRLASAGHRRRFRGRRPGVVWRRLGTGADFVAGAACRFRGRRSTLLLAKKAFCCKVGVNFLKVGVGKRTQNVIGFMT